MSTKFGIIINNNGSLYNEPLIDDCLDKDINEDNSNFNIIEIAYRTQNYFIWTNDLAKFLPDNIKVYPLDNGAQGIYTIKDLKDNII